MSLQDSVEADAKELYWKYYLPRFLLFMVAFTVAGAGLFSLFGQSLTSEIVPFARQGRTLYVVRCEYSSIVRLHDVLIEPVVPDSTTLNRKACPPTYDQALLQKVAETGPGN